MLRIREELTADNRPLLRLSGEIRREWMAELNRTCQDLAGRAGARGVVLDLAEVFFIDAEGIALLATLSSSGVSLTNVSLFVAEQLKGVGHAGM